MRREWQCSALGRACALARLTSEDLLTGDVMAMTLGSQLHGSWGLAPYHFYIAAPSTQRR